MAVALQTEPTASVPALLLRPWSDADVPQLIEAYRDPVLRQWTRIPMENAEDAEHWLELQRRGWSEGDRLSSPCWSPGLTACCRPNRRYSRRTAIFTYGRLVPERSHERIQPGARSKRGET